MTNETRLPWVPPSSVLGKVNWTISCHVTSYSVKLSSEGAEDSAISYHRSLLIDGMVRYPEEFEEVAVQIHVWSVEKPLSEPSYAGYVAIGKIEYLAPIDEDGYSGLFVSHPLEASRFTETVDFIHKTEITQRARLAIEFDVIGLLNDWNKTGALDVTRFAVISVIDYAEN